jgi:hypothetical protein
MMSKFNLLKTISNPCKNSSRHLSSKLSEIHYSVASATEHRKIYDFFEKNFVHHDPMIKSLFQCGIPCQLKDYFQSSINIEPANVIAMKKCNKEIVGVSINSVLQKDDEQIQRFLGIDCDCQMKMYAKYLVELLQTAKLNQVLKTDKIFRINPITMIEDTNENRTEITKKLICNSFEFGKEQKFDFASIHCTTNEMMKIAEEFNFEKIWSSCPKPQEPHQTLMSVYTKKLC